MWTTSTVPGARLTPQCMFTGVWDSFFFSHAVYSLLYKNSNLSGMIAFFFRSLFDVTEPSMPDGAL